MLRVNKAIRPKRLMLYICVSDLVCVVFNGIVFLISTISGGWLMGDMMCQVHGLLGLVLVAGTTWVLAIGAMERYWKLLVPMDHPCMFTEINTKILVFGAYIMMALIGANPLFGIGEYSFLKGKFDFGINVTSEVIADDTPRVAFEDIQVHHVPCLNQSLSVDLLTRKYIEAHMGLTVRSVSWSREAVLFSLQAPHKRSLVEFWSSYVNGSLAQTLNSILGLSSEFKPGPVCHITTWIPADEYTLYSRVYLPFQGLHVCMVDFTNANPHSRMFGGLLIACAVIMPLGIMTFCYGSIYIQQHVDGLYIDQYQSSADGKALKALVLGSVVCLFLLCPYYAINIANGDGAVIPLWVNGLVTVLYYCSGLPVVILYALYDRTFIRQLIQEEVSCHEASGSVKEEQMNDEIIPLNSQAPAKRDKFCEESKV